MAHECPVPSSDTGSASEDQTAGPGFPGGAQGPAATGTQAAPGKGQKGQVPQGSPSQTGKGFPMNMPFQPHMAMPNMAVQGMMAGMPMQGVQPMPMQGMPMDPMALQQQLAIQAMMMQAQTRNPMMQPASMGWSLPAMPVATGHMNAPPTREVPEAASVGSSWQQVGTGFAPMDGSFDSAQSAPKASGRGRPIRRLPQPLRPPPSSGRGKGTGRARGTGKPVAKEETSKKGGSPPDDDGDDDYEYEDSYTYESDEDHAEEETATNDPSVGVTPRSAHREEREERGAGQPRQGAREARAPHEGRPEGSRRPAREEAAEGRPRSKAKTAVKSKAAPKAPPAERGARQPAEPQDYDYDLDPEVASQEDPPGSASSGGTSMA